MYHLFSVPISITSKSQALALIGEWLKEWKEGLGIEAGKSSIQTPAHFPKLITTPNPEIIVAAQNDPELMKALQEADLSIPDGIGIVWALRLPSRLSGIDLMESLILQPQKVSPFEPKLKIMLLGGRPGVAQRAANKLQKGKLGLGREARMDSEGEGESEIFSLYPYLFPFRLPSPNLLSIRALSGPQNISNISRSENNRLIAQVNSFQPDLLFVAFGHGKQEKWLTENRERLTVGVAMAVGGAFDQLANPALRPPPYINSIGLGWLYRLLRQPWRIKRQLALIKFVGMVLGKKLQFPSSKLQ